MFQKIAIILLAFFVSSCTYNSRNLFTITGSGMNFSYGLIAIKNADKIILLRETNMGEGEAKYNIPNMGQYMCSTEAGEAVAEQPVVILGEASAESRVKDIAEINEVKPAEPVNP